MQKGAGAQEKVECPHKITLVAWQHKESIQLSMGPETQQQRN
jgi:hypothetical protein